MRNYRLKMILQNQSYSFHNFKIIVLCFLTFLSITQAKAISNNAKGTVSIYRTSGAANMYLFLDGEPISQIRNGQRIEYAFKESANFNIEVVIPFQKAQNPGRQLEYGSIKVPICDKDKGGLAALSLQGQVGSNYFIVVSGNAKPKIDYGTQKKYDNESKRPTS